MENEAVLSLGNAMVYVGAFAALAFSAMGSVFGTGFSASAAIGAWKKCYVQKRPAPFQLIILCGVPLSQTIYGMILMFVMLQYGHAAVWPVYVGMGVLGGLCIGGTAWYQGKGCAAACDAFGDTNEGFINYLMVFGVIETVAIFVLAFGIVVVITLDKSLSVDVLSQSLQHAKEAVEAVAAQPALDK
jgi:V/A-type H+-transporting ATPase subunit K